MSELKATTMKTHAGLERSTRGHSEDYGGTEHSWGGGHAAWGLRQTGRRREDQHQEGRAVSSTKLDSRKKKEFENEKMLRALCNNSR